MKHVATLLVFIVLNYQSYSQESNPFDIEGQIIDRTTNHRIPYASIAVENQSYGTSSNDQGEFSLTIPTSLRSKDFVLTVSCLGFKSARIVGPGDSLTVYLTPAVIELKAVEFSASTQDPKRIVKKAFSNVSKNYYSKSFVYETFYRHSCKDDGAYGRLIEAAIDIYKPNGHKLIRPRPGYKEEVKVRQLRRTYDRTELRTNHAPISLYSVMGVDPASYQIKTKKVKWIVLNILRDNDVSSLKTAIDDFVFEFEGITEYDGEEVYKIFYSRHDTLASVNGASYNIRQQGMLYINTKDYGFLKSEYLRARKNDSVRAVTIYKKYNGKYFHHYTMTDGNTYYEKDNLLHYYHLELMTSNIRLKQFEKFTGKQPDKEMLLSVPYDSTFWQDYNILKSTPLDDYIVRDLQKDQKLDLQYASYQKEARELYYSGKEDEERFNQFVKARRGVKPVFVDLWASGCESCVEEFSDIKRLEENYIGKIDFVYVSLDDDIEKWKKAIVKNRLTTSREKHFRIGGIGGQSDLLKLWNVNALPRYILIGKNGQILDLNARRPGGSDLAADFEKALQEEVKK